MYIAAAPLLASFLRTMLEKCYALVVNFHDGPSKQRRAIDSQLLANDLMTSEAPAGAPGFTTVAFTSDVLDARKEFDYESAAQ